MVVDYEHSFFSLFSRRGGGEIELHLRVVTCEDSKGSSLHLLVYKLYSIVLGQSEIHD